MGELVVDNVVLGVPEPVGLPVDEGVEDWLAVEEEVWVGDGVPIGVCENDGVFDGVHVVEPVWDVVDVPEPVSAAVSVNAGVADEEPVAVAVELIVSFSVCASAVQTEANARTRRSRVRQVFGAPRRATWVRAGRSDITVGASAEPLIAPGQPTGCAPWTPSNQTQPGYTAQRAGVLRSRGRVDPTFPKLSRQTRGTEQLFLRRHPASLRTPPTPVRWY